MNYVEQKTQESINRQNKFQDCFINALRSHYKSQFVDNLVKLSLESKNIDELLYDVIVTEPDLAVKIMDLINYDHV